MLRALKPTCEQRWRHVLRWLRLYGDQAYDIALLDFVASPLISRETDREVVSVLVSRNSDVDACLSKVHDKHVLNQHVKTSFIVRADMAKNT